MKRFCGGGKHEDTRSKGKGEGLGVEEYLRIIEGGTDSQNSEG